MGLYLVYHSVIALRGNAQVGAAANGTAATAKEYAASLKNTQNFNTVKNYRLPYSNALVHEARLLAIEAVRKTITDASAPVAAPAVAAAQAAIDAATRARDTALIADVKIFDLFDAVSTGSYRQVVDAFYAEVKEKDHCKAKKKEDILDCARYLDSEKFKIRTRVEKISHEVFSGTDRAFSDMITLFFWVIISKLVSSEEIP